jgi:hypothetical protein
MSVYRIGRNATKLNKVVKFTLPMSLKNLTSLRLYRILLRQIRALPAQHIFLQPPLNPNESYGKAEHIPNSKAFNSTRDDIFRLLCSWNSHNTFGPADTALIGKNTNDPWWNWYMSLVSQSSNNYNSNYSDYNDDDDDDDDDEKNEMCGWTNRDTLHQAVRFAFDFGKQLLLHDTEKEKIVQYQTFAIRAIRSLEQVRHMHQLSSISIQDGLRVVATSR